MKVIFLDFDGTINSKQEVLYHRTVRNNRIFAKLRNKIGYLFGKYIGHAVWRVLPDKYKSTWTNFSLFYFTDHNDFCPIACHNLKWLMDQIPEAKIVITSTWRHTSGLYWCKRILARNGIDASRVIGITPIYGCLRGESYPRLGATSRGHQIRGWLEMEAEEKVTHFVVLDDEEIGGGQVENHFVKCDPHLGFTIRNGYKALKLLGAEEMPEETVFDY